MIDLNTTKMPGLLLDKALELLHTEDGFKNPDMRARILGGFIQAAFQKESDYCFYEGREST